MPVIPSSGTARARVGYRALAYTAGAQSSGVDPAFPISRMADLRWYRRSTRSIEGANAPGFQLHLDFGRDVEVAALSIELANFATCTIQYATNAAPATFLPFADEEPTGYPWVSPGPGTWVDTSGVDLEDGRQKKLVVPPAPRVGRHVFVGPFESGRNDPYILGNLGAWGELTTLFKNPGTPYRKTHDDTYDGSTTPTRIVLDFPAKLERANLVSVEQFLLLGRAPRERVMLWDENEGDLSKWYHVRRNGAAETARESGPYLDVSGLQFREVGDHDDE